MRGGVDKEYHKDIWKLYHLQVGDATTGSSGSLFYIYTHTQNISKLAV